MRNAQTSFQLNEQVQHLRELIEALDRRVPHIERVGEAGIARDGERLRNKALKRIGELEPQLRSLEKG